MKNSLLKECCRIAIRHNTPALHPEWGRSHHFCFIIQENKIVEWATNHPGNAQSFHGFSPERHKIHAEILAYKRAKGMLRKNVSFEAVNIRLNKLGQIRLSAPCKCCTSFLKTVGCRRTYFTTDIGWANVT